MANEEQVRMRQKQKVIKKLIDIMPSQAVIIFLLKRWRFNFSDKTVIGVSVYLVLAMKCLEI